MFSPEMMLHAGLMLLSVFLSTVSQVMLKKSAKKRYDVWWREYLNLWVISAYGLYVVTTILSILAYRVIPLSMGIILNATGYFYMAFFGVKLFGETLRKKKILALALLVCGIAIYALFDQVVGTVVLF